MTDKDFESLGDSIRFSDEVLLSRLGRIELSDGEREALRFAWGELEAEADKFVTGLYRRFMDTPELASVLAAEVRIARLRELQLNYLRDLFCRPIDSEYLASRLKIGLVHHRIRITPQWYLASYAHFMCEHIEPLISLATGSAEGLNLIIALFKSIMFDAGVVLDSYGMHEDAALLANRQNSEHEPATERHQAWEQGGKSGGRPATGRDMSRISLDEDETTRRANYIGFDSDDLVRLRSLREVFVGTAPDVLNDFYRFIREVPELSELVPEDQVGRLVRQVSSYWHEFVEGRFDQSHAASRMRIGVMHERIGLSPPWYFIGLTRQAIGFMRTIPTDRPDYAAMLKSFFRGFFFDLTFVIDAYMAARADTLTHSESYAVQLMSGLTSAVAVVDSHARVIYANDVFLDFTGIEPALLYMMNLRDVVAPPEVFALIARLRQKQLSKSIGTCRWGTTDFRVSVIELEQHSERSLRPLALVFDDIGNLMHLSDEIEKDALQYKRLANTISAVLWEMELPSETIVTISHQAIDFTGYRDVSFLGRAKAWVDCIIAEDQSRFRACIASLTRGGQTSCEYRMRRADGREIWVSSHLSRSREGEGTAFVSAVTIDVTQGKLADQQRMTAIGQIAGGIAHVLNNSLTVIMGNLELQETNPEGSNTDGYLKSAVNACQKAANIVAELQGFSGGRVLQPREFNIAQFVADQMVSFHELVDSSISLVKRSADMDWICRADDKLLQIAIGHLITNSRQAMPSGGEIIIATRAVRQGTLAFDDPGFDKEWVELSVIDNGAGMSDEVKRRAVEPFFSTRNLAERNGLGLSFVYGFVMQSGGHLIIESELGRGSTVRIRFPRHTAALGRFDSPPVDKNRVSILLVEDNDAVRNMTMQLLRRLGYAVMATANSAEALLAVERAPVDLLLSDICLGDGVDGIVLAHQLRNKYPELGVILMSGFATDMTSQGVPMDCGVLTKPFSITKLKELLIRVLKK